MSSTPLLATDDALVYSAVDSAVDTLEHISHLATDAALKFKPDEDTGDVAVPISIRRRLIRNRKHLISVHRSTRKLHPVAASYVLAAKVASDTILREMRSAVGAHIAACTLDRWQYQRGPSRRAAARLELSTRIPRASTCGDASDLVHAVAYMDAIRDIDGAAALLRCFVGVAPCPPSLTADSVASNNDSE